MTVRRTAINRLSKRDREQVSGDDVYRRFGETDCDVVRANLAVLGSQSGRSSLSNTDLASTFHFLGTYFRVSAIRSRFLLDDPSALATGLATSARLGYLKRIAGGSGYSGGYDCMHVFDLLLATACRDETAIDAFVDRFPPPFRAGHPTTVLLCNGVYAALGRHPASLASLAPKLRSRKESKFFRAMYDCLTAIADSSRANAMRAMAELLRGNRRQDFHLKMDKIVCIEAHAFHEICSRTSPELLDGMDSQTSFPWDADYKEYLQSSSPEARRPIDLTAANGVLGRWIDELPKTVAIDELLATL